MNAEPVPPRRTPVRRAVTSALKRLPAPRDEAAMRVARAAKDLVAGRAAPKPAPEKARPSSTVVPHLKPGPALKDTETWVLPPRSEGHDKLTEVTYDTGATAPKFDLALFEQLNEEYADKPIIARPTSFKAEDRWDAGRRRLKWTHRHTNLPGKTTLEIGCSNGYEVWMLANNLGCDAYGIDVNARGAWADLAGPKAHYEVGDMAAHNPYQDNFFDVVMSYAVWEHVTHPQTLLQETYNVLKPGGRAWIRANLYCGPQASHRYRHINFPWPHLLFSDDVVKEWDLKNNRPPRGITWVNRLTFDNYRRIVEEIGFDLKHVAFQEPKWDEEFYQRFEDMLGRWPKRDLQRDFVLMVLEKPLDA